MDMTMNLHRIVSITLEPQFDNVSGELTWIDLLAINDEGHEQEVTFFCALDTTIDLQAQGNAIEFDNGLVETDGTG